MAALSDALLREWRADISALNADPEPARAAMNDILHRHSEPHRAYHGLSHLEALFRLLAQHAPRLKPARPARLAVWWHDVIYDPQARDNEERSAELARAQLAALNAPAAVIDATVSLILRTKNHWNGATTGEGDLFLDADIAVLGAPASVYDRYAEAVRREYAFAPDDAYCKGRQMFLESVMARDPIFRTQVFETAYDMQARANLAREFASLDAARNAASS